MGRYSNGKWTKRKPQPKPTRTQELTIAEVEEEEGTADHAFARLPPELVVHVLSFVPHRSARTVLRVCRVFRSLLTSADCDFIWARWCEERWPGAVSRISDTKEPRGHWQAFFRATAGEYEVTVYHWCMLPIKLERVRAEHKVEDLLSMLPKSDRVNGYCAYSARSLLNRFDREATFYLRTAKGDWHQVQRNVPLYTCGLSGEAGQAGWRISCSLWDATFDETCDLDFDNLDRHTKEELVDWLARDHDNCVDQTQLTRYASKPKEEVIQAIRKNRPSQFSLS